MADVESGQTTVVRVSDDEVVRAGRRTGWALFALSALMAAFCLSMMAVFAKEMADVAGDYCVEYGVTTDGTGSTCQYAKENWCAALNTGGPGGGVSVGCSPGSTSFADPDADYLRVRKDALGRAMEAPPMRPLRSLRGSLSSSG